MATIVIIPGGYHPYHAGHLALYQSAQRAFPDADVYVAATDDVTTRPFPFQVKEKLAQLAGVDKGRFMRVKSPFKAEEITAPYNPARDTLIFVRSEKDSTKPPQAGGVKQDGSPAYLQPLLDAKRLEPFGKHAYMAYLPTVEFGPGMTSATEIRTAWPTLNEKRKTALVMSLYPRTQGNTKLAATVVKLLDAAIGTEQGVAEARVEINQDAPDNLYDIQDNLAMSRWKSSVKNVITSLFAKRYPGVQLFFKNTQDGNLFVTTDKSALASEDVGLYSNTDEFGASIIGPTAEYGVDDILYVGIGFDSIKSGKYKGIVGEMLKTIVPPLAAKFKAKPAIVIVVEDQSAGAWEAMANKLGWAFISGEDEQGVAEGFESSIQKKIQAKQDSLSLAREQRRARGQRQQGPREIKLQAEIDKLNTELTQLKRQGVAEGLAENSDQNGWYVLDTKNRKIIANDVSRERAIAIAKSGGYSVWQTENGTFINSAKTVRYPGLGWIDVSETMNEQGVAEDSLNEFAVDGFGDSGDNRSKLLASVGRLLDGGNKVDWQVPGQMGHVTRVQNDGITMKRWKMPRSRMSFFLPMSDDSRDSKYTIKMVAPKHYAVVSAAQGMAEAATKCPPATQDIGINLENRQKAIDEYGYGPLNPDLPNTKFWMLKVDEWNLDSMEEAQQSLCGNCAAFDVRQDTLDCIAQGIDSDSPDDAEGVIDAGELGYCKFLKFKCASRRTCDAWVTGGPLVDKPVDENQGWAATLESDQVDVATDPELVHARRFARQHYPEFSGDEDLAFAKWVQRGLGHSEKNDREHDRKLKQLTNKVAMLQAALQQQAKNSDYLEEKWSAEYKSSIDCNNPRGFSQKAHCAGRKK